MLLPVRCVQTPRAERGAKPCCSFFVFVAVVVDIISSPQEERYGMPALARQRLLLPPIALRFCMDVDFAGCAALFHDDDDIIAGDIVSVIERDTLFTPCAAARHEPSAQHFRRAAAPRAMRGIDRQHGNAEAKGNIRGANRRCAARKRAKEVHAMDIRSLLREKSGMFQIHAAAFSSPLSSGPSPE